MIRTVSFATLGCRLNQVDTQELQARLEAEGFRTVPEGEPADVIVVNSCAVTARAELSDRQTIHRAARRHPTARIVVTGCWAQIEPDAVARLGAVDLVAGNADKPRLPQLISRLLSDGAPSQGGPAIHVSDVARTRGLAAAPLAEPPGRSRAFVKIQEGCQHRCAFCIVPYARGASRSREPGIVLAQVRELVGGGHREVVLTGVDLGHYGADLTPRTTLAALLRDMMAVPGLRWIRLSSLLPAYLTEELIEVITHSPMIAPHLHIPLQSGSDAVLRRMRRPYTVGMYRRAIDRLTVIPALGLGADVIVGFPGEREEDFDATFALVAELPFSYLHVFAYSDRRGTEAARAADHVDRRVIAARSRRLRALAQAKNRAFRERLVGTAQETVILERRDPATGMATGLTGNYVEVVFAGRDARPREITRVRVTAVEAARTFGEAA